MQCDYVCKFQVFLDAKYVCKYVFAYNSIRVAHVGADSDALPLLLFPDVSEIKEQTKKNESVNG